MQPLTATNPFGGTQNRRRANCSAAAVFLCRQDHRAADRHQGGAHGDHHQGHDGVDDHFLRQPLEGLLDPLPEFCLDGEGILLAADQLRQPIRFALDDGYLKDAEAGLAKDADALQLPDMLLGEIVGIAVGGLLDVGGSPSHCPHRPGWPSRSARFALPLLRFSWFFPSLFWICTLILHSAPGELSIDF